MWAHSQQTHAACRHVYIANILFIFMFKHAVATEPCYGFAMELLRNQLDQYLNSIPVISSTKHLTKQKEIEKSLIFGCTFSSDGY